MLEIQLVLNTDFGGFSVDSEMALWLIENRGWKLIPANEFDYKTKYPVNTLIDSTFADLVHAPNANTLEFRSHPDLIDCVKAVKLAHKKDSFPASRYGHIQKLSIKNVKVHLEIEDYHDGKEKINCWVE